MHTCLEATSEDKNFAKDTGPNKHIFHVFNTTWSISFDEICPLFKDQIQAQKLKFNAMLIKEKLSLLSEALKYLLSVDLNNFNTNPLILTEWFWMKS